MKFFRIAQAGATTDGREISAAWIDQAAKNYKRDKYTALVNLEHYRGIHPDSAFKSYGDVVALKAEDVDGKRTLFAQINPTPELVAFNKARQKLFSSIELNPNFAGSGEAYLVGLAVTDSPASLGTEMLKFAAGQGDNNPLTPRKQTPGNLFTVAEPLELNLETESTEGTESLLEKFNRFTSLLKSSKTKTDQQYGDVRQVLDAVAESMKTQVDEITELRETVNRLETELKSDRDNFTQFKYRMDTTPAGESRPITTGGSGGSFDTDC
ncbi:GPO family capsid scaffolding protein [Chitinimonas sp. PSY-7]|uniref:GPO family capsid scaffolding protein n=1 Tax=Chitinimonas sp. PSY-7 TaxID=3459088 RepID=UPI00404005EA